MKTALIQPYSGINTDNAAVLKHFWKCNGTYQGGMQDSIGGAHFLPTGANQMGGDNTYVSPHADGPMPVSVSAPFQSPGTKTLLMFSVYSCKGSTIGSWFHATDVGAGAGEWELCQGIGSDSYITDDSSAGDGGAIHTLTPIARQLYPIGLGFLWTPGVTADSFWIDSDGSVTQQDLSAQLGNIAGGIDSFTQTMQIGGNATNGMDKCYGLTHMHFDAEPSDYLIGCQWMMAEWLRGNKSIYPTWI